MEQLQKSGAWWRKHHLYCTAGKGASLKAATDGAETAEQWLEIDSTDELHVDKMKTCKLP